ncbi:MAG: hypothetical protein LBN95_01665 [Prevotellaceae bacterium]|jgi:hypothetical protein|nr:hypothetical protein [Prevotellaceae bacterium]
MLVIQLELLFILILFNLRTFSDIKETKKRIKRIDTTLEVMELVKSHLKTEQTSTEEK